MIFHGDPLSNGFLAGPDLLRHHLTDNRHAGSRRAIAIREIASAQHPDSDGLEITRTHGRFNHGIIPRQTPAPFELEIPSDPPLTERQPVHRSRYKHSWQPRKLLQGTLVKFPH